MAEDTWIMRGLEWDDPLRIREYPLTLECSVLYAQDQVLEEIPKDSLDRFYSGEESTDFHTMYVGEIVDSYIIR